MENPKFRDIKDLLEQKQDFFESFAEKLLHYIRLKEMTNAKVYNTAGVKPDCFSKIISGKTKHAEKNTVVSLILAFGLDIDQAEDLPESAQYSLLKHNRSDIIVRFCIENNTKEKTYSIDDVNELLSYYNLPLIGGVA